MTARQRYCGEPCREEAKAWREWRAQVQYRRTDRGRQVRRDQSRRWRERQGERERRARPKQTTEGVASPGANAEGSPATPVAPPDPPSLESDTPKFERPNDKIAGEGHPLVLPEGFFCCDRPGCYAVFRGTRRSPLRRFCNLACRMALRCVRLRERSWSRRGRRGRVAAPTRGCRSPTRRQNSLTGMAG
jgi:hypothetical protein